MRVLLVTNINKAQVRPACEALLPWIRQRVELVGVETDTPIDLASLDVDTILVFGGDGTLLSTARRLQGRQIPLMGVNFGRLGFLASFTPDEFKDSFQAFVEGKLPISTRMQLEASIVPANVDCPAGDVAEVHRRRRFVSSALNDAVLVAGSPFRMIELMVSVDDDHGVSYSGDGVILATASGSTAYNLSAGGPILSPQVQSMCVTPICPHSVSFRPVVIDGSAVVSIRAMRVNRGTTLSCDGQSSTNLGVGERVIIRRHAQDVLLVENPNTRQWRTLAEKLNWAASPNYTGR
jgi:NAD+ kinase